jgi:hypothetical protein
MWFLHLVQKAADVRPEEETLELSAVVDQQANPQYDVVSEDVDHAPEQDPKDEELTGSFQTCGDLFCLLLSQVCLPYLRLIFNRKLVGYKHG